MADGYTEYDVALVLGRVSDASGVRLACVWARRDHLGFDGDSQFYVVRQDGSFLEVAGDLWRWLNDDPADGPASPGHPGTWAGRPAGFTAADLDVTDGCGNYAAHGAAGRASQRRNRGRALAPPPLEPDAGAPQAEP